MRRDDFLKALKECGVGTDIVCFNDPVRDDVFCVRDTYGGVEVFYRERGTEFGLREFPTQGEALGYLLERIREISGNTSCGQGRAITRFEREKMI